MNTVFRQSILIFLVIFCFGSGACEVEEDDGSGCASIGWMDLYAEGVVLTIDNNPIQGIEISVHSCSSTLSDADGKWQLYDDDCQEFDVDEIRVIATDIDGTDNDGQFQSTEIWVPLTQIEPSNMDLCFFGGFSATNIEIVMELAE